MFFLVFSMNLTIFHCFCIDFQCFFHWFSNAFSIVFPLFFQCLSFAFLCLYACRLSLYAYRLSWACTRAGWAEPVRVQAGGSQCSAAGGPLRWSIAPEVDGPQDHRPHLNAFPFILHCFSIDFSMLFHWFFNAFSIDFPLIFNATYAPAAGEHR